MKEVIVVAATKETTAVETYLSKSLFGMGVELKSVCNHTSSLADAYNPFLREEFKDHIVAFAHADVWVDDFFLKERMNEAMRRFDVVGVAGCTVYDPGDVSWAFKSDMSGWKDQRFLSGAIRHSDPRAPGISYFGETPRQCALLDGVFLAVNTSRILQMGVKFDPQFKFDFYDLDFCRSCVKSGLMLGTWPIAMTHASAGRFGSLDWHIMKQRFLKKWAEIPTVEVYHEAVTHA